jgi:hypothetical protein
MGPKQDARTLYTISCACGHTVSLDARGFGRPIVCKKCGGSFTVGWSKDPTTRKAAPVAVNLARKRGATPLRVSCSCGYSRAVSASEAAGHNRCPGCGKVMIVEKPAGRTQESDRMVKLSSAPPPSSRSGKSEPRLIKITPGSQTVDCICGEKILVRPQSIGQTTVCPGCSRRIVVEIKDPSSTKLPAISKTPTPPPGAFAKPEAMCECGRAIEIVKAFDANGTVCICGRTITMEKIRHTQSKHTLIRPRIGPKGGGAPAPRAPEATPKAPAPVPSEGLYEMPAVDFTIEEPAPAEAPSAGYQAVFCPCGEALMVGAEDSGKNIQCPTCLTLIAVDQVRDISGNMVLRVRAIGKMDQDTWSLSDFK